MGEPIDLTGWATWSVGGDHDGNVDLFDGRWCHVAHEEVIDAMLRCTGAWRLRLAAEDGEISRLSESLMNVGLGAPQTDPNLRQLLSDAEAAIKALCRIRDGELPEGR